MTFRPRHAGDGRLRLPSHLKAGLRSLDHPESLDFFASFTGHTADPFARTEEDLLLAEAFARVDLGTSHRASVRWLERHGTLDLQHFFPDEGFETHDRPLAWRTTSDLLVDIERQQANVRWHLETLVHLSDNLELRVPAVTEAADGAWDRRWCELLLDGPEELTFLGGTTDEEVHLRPLPRVRGRRGDVFGPAWSFEPDLPVGTTAAAIAAWSPATRRTWQRLQAEGLPMVWIPSAVWELDWLPFWPEWAERRRASDITVDDWWGLAAIQRRLLAPYVRRAIGESVVVDIVPRGFGEVATSETGEETIDWRGPYELRQRRAWSSLLAPVYLQLLEGHLRVTEGSRAAALCRECGQPFLTLDARRLAFCNDRERYRHGQRAFRERALAAKAQLHGSDADDGAR